MTLKVGLAASARFHFYDLARQLKLRGLLHKFVTGYPLSRVSDEGLNGHLVSAPWIFAPMMILARQGRIGHAISEAIHPYASRSIDQAALKHLGDCDAIISSSSCGLEAGRAAKAREALWLCDRGVAHIGWQDRILQEEADRWGLPRRPIPRMSIERELAEYEEADAVLTPSRFVQRTFAEEGIPVQRAPVVRLGADLKRFHRSKENSKMPLIVFAGTVSLQKGIPDLLAAFRLLKTKNVRLVAAGPIDPQIAPLLRDHPNGFELPGKLERTELSMLMSEAWVLVLPSIQDGFGMVAAEAMACETPAIISENAGACELIDEGVNGWTVPARSPEALAEALDRALANPQAAEEMGRAARASMQALGGWASYGAQIEEILCSRLRTIGAG